MTSTQGRPARDLLDFYAEAGVDALVGEEPVDRFAIAEPPRRLARHAPARHRHSRPGPRRPVAAPPAPDEAALAARAAAKNAETLEELRGILDKFDGCALKATASQLVFADGNPKARRDAGG